VDSPEFFKKALGKLAKEQRKLSKKQKGSKNKEKQQLKVARIHQKISDQRSDFLHKLTTGLVEDSQFDCFCIEDLNLDGMKRVWGRKVSDLSYYEFTRQLAYKAAKSGKRVIKIGRFEPSSQICSSCGHRQKMPLEMRTYVCPKCGQTIDRDVNAAINIRNFALRTVISNFKSANADNTDGTSGNNACGVQDLC
jgi:putative transposase